MKGRLPLEEGPLMAPFTGFRANERGSRPVLEFTPQLRPLESHFRVSQGNRCGNNNRQSDRENSTNGQWYLWNILQLFRSQVLKKAPFSMRFTFLLPRSCPKTFFYGVPCKTILPGYCPRRVPSLPVS